MFEGVSINGRNMSHQKGRGFDLRIAPPVDRNIMFDRTAPEFHLPLFSIN